MLIAFLNVDDRFHRRATDLLVASTGPLRASAVTVGGAAQSTWGMRMMGLRVVTPASGLRVDFLTAAIHALLFYVAISTFLLWFVDILFGLMRSDRRLGHDVLVGLAVVRL